MNATFLARIDKTGDCWMWTGRVDKYGYGRLSPHRAHRLAYQTFIGAIPAGMQVDHRCHNEDADCPGGRVCLHRRCVNPAHLQLLTLEGNAAAARSSRRFCANGHEFTPENSYTRPDDGYRKCRRCMADAAARYQQRRRAA
jgi:hypothetical protein